uniref:Uncharacterized protein n=1 Tax=Sphaerodactylus townsendi TaxID=933632 RepID=A0ACB8FH10_9SAUR
MKLTTEQRVDNFLSERDEDLALLSPQQMMVSTSLPKADNSDKGAAKEDNKTNAAAKLAFQKSAFPALSCSMSPAPSGGSELGVSSPSLEHQPPQPWPTKAARKDTPYSEPAKDTQNKS